MHEAAPGGRGPPLSRPPAGPDLRRIAARLVGILGEEQCVLVGGLAVAAHGYVRATDDVDVLTRLDLSQAKKLLREHGIDVVLLRGDTREGDFPCLKGALNGVRFDVLPPLVPIEWERAARIPVGPGAVLPVVDLEGLLRLKLRAGGPQDLVDTAHLLLQHPKLIEQTREMARSYRLEDRLDTWLRDSRVRLQAEETLRQRGVEGRQVLAQLSKLLPKSSGPRRGR